MPQDPNDPRIQQFYRNQRQQDEAGALTGDAGASRELQVIGQKLLPSNHRLGMQDIGVAATGMASPGRGAQQPGNAYGVSPQDYQAGMDAYRQNAGVGMPESMAGAAPTGGNLIDEILATGVGAALARQAFRTPIAKAAAGTISRAAEPAREHIAGIMDRITQYANQMKMPVQQVMKHVSDQMKEHAKTITAGLQDIAGQIEDAAQPTDAGYQAARKARAASKTPAATPKGSSQTYDGTKATEYRNKTGGVTRVSTKGQGAQIISKNRQKQGLGNMYDQQNAKYRKPAAKPSAAPEEPKAAPSAKPSPKPSPAAEATPKPARTPRARKTPAPVASAAPKPRASTDPASLKRAADKAASKPKSEPSAAASAPPVKTPKDPAKKAANQSAWRSALQRAPKEAGDKWKDMSKAEKDALRKQIFKRLQAGKKK